MEKDFFVVFGCTNTEELWSRKKQSLYLSWIPLYVKACFYVCVSVQLKDRVYCNICLERLRGYLTSCSSLLGVTMETQTPSLFDRAEATRKKQYQVILLCTS